jgi:Elongator subunit Iki1
VQLETCEDLQQRSLLMFASRTFGHEISDKDGVNEVDIWSTPFIFVEEPPQSNASQQLDKGIVPALLALIAKDIGNLRQRLNPRGLPASVTSILLALARPVSSYAALASANGIVVDGFRDWHGIHACSDSDQQNCVSISAASGFEKVLNALDTRSQGVGMSQSIYIVDSLNPCSRVDDFLPRLTAALEQWRSSSRIVAFVTSFRNTCGSSDRERFICEALKALATTRVTVCTPASSTLPGGFRGGIESTPSIVEICISRLRPSGRVHVERVTALHNPSKGTLTVLQPDELLNQAKTIPPPSDSTEEAAARKRMELLGLTFKVDLTDQERAARDGVQLPYVHQNKEIADGGLEMHPKYLSADRDQTAVGEYSSPDECEEEYEESEDV